MTGRYKSPKYRSKRYAGFNHYRAKKPTVFFAILFFLGFAVVSYNSYQNRLKDLPDLDERLVEAKGFTGLQIILKSQSITLRKFNKKWEVVSINTKPVVDARANQDLIAKLIDLIKYLPRTNEEKVDPAKAKDYGVSPPRMAVKLFDGSDTPSYTLSFGNLTLNAQEVYVFVTEYLWLLRTNPNIVTLLSSKKVQDFRNRKITEFSADDVLELKTSGKKCARLHLFRDGDTWVWKSKAPTKNTDQWLGNLTDSKYIKVDPKHDTSNLICEISLKGWRGNTETISVFNDLWTVNSELKGTYRLSKKFGKLLKIKQ